MKKHFKWLLGLVAGLLSAGSMSAADYNIVTYKYCAPTACTDKNWQASRWDAPGCLPIMIWDIREFGPERRD